MQQTKKHVFENEDKNGTENENILDFLYCYNYNQNLLFDWIFFVLVFTEEMYNYPYHMTLVEKIH